MQEFKIKTKSNGGRYRVREFNEIFMSKLINIMFSTSSVLIDANTYTQQYSNLEPFIRQILADKVRLLFRMYSLFNDI